MDAQKATKANPSQQNLEDSFLPPLMLHAKEKKKFKWQTKSDVGISHLYKVKHQGCLCLTTRENYIRNRKHR